MAWVTLKHVLCINVWKCFQLSFHSYAFSSVLPNHACRIMSSVVHRLFLAMFLLSATVCLVLLVWSVSTSTRANTIAVDFEATTILWSSWNNSPLNNNHSSSTPGSLHRKPSLTETSAERTQSPIVHLFPKVHHLEPQRPKPAPVTSTTSAKPVTVGTTQPTPSTTGIEATSTTNTQARIGGGYVMAADYYEEATMASRNLFQLQCWAKSLDLSVVKPVIQQSYLKTTIDLMKRPDVPKFEDIFDYKDWEKFSKTASVSHLSSWEEFESEAPRDVIIANFIYPSLSDVRARGNNVLPSQPGRFKQGCSSNWPGTKELEYLKSKGFRVIRRVCFNFFYGDQLTVREFNSHLMGEQPTSSVTVLMETWRGLGPPQRVLLTDSVCMGVIVQEFVKLSSRLQGDAERYIREYLSNGDYIAVMGRLGMSLLTISYKKGPIVPFCLQETLAELSRFKQKCKVNQTFLSIDIGKYGAQKFRYSSQQAVLANDFDKFVSAVYGQSLNTRAWEETFEKVSSYRDAGYIAQLQKTIVSRARCILFVGGGAFQRHTYNLYRDIGTNNGLVEAVSACTHKSKVPIPH